MKIMKLRVIDVKELLDQVSHWAPFLIVAYSVVVFAATQSPFNYTLEPAQIFQRSEPVEWLPFSYLPPCGFDLGMKALNLAMLIPFGFLLALRIRTSRSSVETIWTVGLLAALFSLGIEAAQFFLPSRQPSATDLVLNSVGGMVGAWLSVALQSRSGYRE